MVFCGVRLLCPNADWDNASECRQPSGAAGSVGTLVASSSVSGSLGQKSTQAKSQRPSPHGLQFKSSPAAKNSVG